MITTPGIVASIKTVLCTAVGMCGLALISPPPAVAELLDRGGGLIYDTERNITWLVDANAASVSGGPDGQLTWPEAMDWVARFEHYDAARDTVWTDWRLPDALDPGDPEPCFGFACPKGEMGNLHFAQQIDRDNPGPFRNVQGASYWTRNSRAPLFGAWLFHFGISKQDYTGPFEDLLVAFVWPVRDGDVVLDAPNARDDQVEVIEGGTSIISPAANDSDANNDLDPTSVRIEVPPVSGELSPSDQPGELVYTHDGSESLIDQFSYTVADQTGARSSPGIVRISVLPGNDPPVFISQPVVDAVEAQTYRYRVSVSDPDVTDTIRIESGALPGWLTLVMTGDRSAELTGNPSGKDSASEVEIVLTAMDATVSVQQQFAIRVTAAPEGPILELRGDNPVKMVAGATFDDPGVSATDLQDGDISHQVTVDGTVDTNVPGTYVLTYSATDSAGLSATAERRVEVSAATVESTSNGGSTGGGGSVSPGPLLCVALLTALVRRRRPLLAPRRRPQPL